MSVVLYHIYAGDDDYFTCDYDDARREFYQLVAKHKNAVTDVHWHVEEYASDEDYDADRMSREECIMTSDGVAA